MLSEAATMRNVRRNATWTVAGLVVYLIVIVILRALLDPRSWDWLSWLILPVVVAAFAWLFVIPFVRRRAIRARRRELRGSQPNALILAAEVSNVDDAGFIGIVSPETHGLRVRWLGDEAGELLPWTGMTEVKHVRFGELLRVTLSEGDRLWIRVLGPAAVSPSSFGSLELVRAIEPARQAARRALEPY